MVSRLITAPFRLLYLIFAYAVATVYFILTLLLTEVAGVYTYLRYLRPEAFARLSDGESTLTDLADILLSVDVILVMIGLVPGTFAIMYIAQTTDGSVGGE